MTKIRNNCRFFDGSKPCIMNKKYGFACSDCDSYSKYNKRILIIKLDAIGDVLRTTCILVKIKEQFPFSFIAWITKPESIELLSSNPNIDRVIDYNDAGLLARLHIEEWDYVYSLDNAHSSAALASFTKAKIKKGFLLSKHGIITPTNTAALKWLTMAVFDRAKKENLKSYQEIMYGICGFASPISKPNLTIAQSIIQWVDKLFCDFLPGIEDKPIIIGVNTGSGSRWSKKMLDEENIIKVIRELLEDNSEYYIILLGGPDEREKNNNIAKMVKSERVINIGCNYSILQFSAIIKKCNVILTGDTLALHIASALDVPVAALFGPTSSNEIYDYDGLILKMRTQIECLGCYNDCNKSDNCMNLFSINQIIENIKKQINYKN